TPRHRFIPFPSENFRLPRERALTGDKNAIFRRELQEKIFGRTAIRFPEAVTRPQSEGRPRRRAISVQARGLPAQTQSSAAPRPTSAQSAHRISDYGDSCSAPRRRVLLVEGGSTRIIVDESGS